MSGRPTNARLVALAAAAFALFNYPLLAVFDTDALVLGLPLVWVYVLVVWSLLIVLVGLTLRDR